MATRWAFVRSLCAMSAVGALTACGSSHAGERGDPAVWYVAGNQSLRPSSTTVQVTVTRTGCSSGRQGTPLAPVIDTSDDAVTITFRIDPHISRGTCEGTAGVGYVVRLGEPIGKRALVDGSCHSVSGLSSTAFCGHDGVRIRWRHGELRVVGGS